MKVPDPLRKEYTPECKLTSDFVRGCGKELYIQSVQAKHMLTQLSANPTLVSHVGSQLCAVLKAGLEQGQCEDPRKATRTALGHALSLQGVRSSERLTRLKPKQRFSIFGNIASMILGAQPILHLDEWDDARADTTLNAIYRAELARRRKDLASLAAGAERRGVSVTTFALDYGDAGVNEAGLKGLQAESLADHADLDLSTDALAPLCRRRS